MITLVTYRNIALLRRLDLLYSVRVVHRIPGAGIDLCDPLEDEQYLWCDSTFVVSHLHGDLVHVPAECV